MTIKLTNEEFKNAVNDGKVLTFNKVFNDTVKAWNDTFNYHDVLPITNSSLTNEDDVDWITDRVDGIDFDLDVIGFAGALKDSDNGEKYYSTNPYNYIKASNLYTDELDDKLWFDGNDKTELITNHSVDELE